tara:strand:+ start:95271 stop:95528 length:258 start_codon:yes stop_codon:yes gene_type:complete
MIQSYMIEDRWINFVLLNGWRLKAEVNEETGDMTILVSNENGDVFKQDVFRNLDPPTRTPEDISLHSLKEQELNFKLIANEEESN